jgi:transposase
MPMIEKAVGGDGENVADESDVNAGCRLFGLLAKAGVQCVMPPKKNWKEPRADDEERCKARYLIENLFAKLKPFQAIATRYDKCAQTFLGAVYLAASLIWLN